MSVGGNMFLYTSARLVKHNEYTGPDVLVVLGVEPRERKSWVVWDEEGRNPDLVIESTSSSTAVVDRGRKKCIGQDTMRVPVQVL